jgi:GNAT superfamily N-acetyltransferase
MELSYEPPIPPKPSAADGFFQTVRLTDAGRTIGTARWNVRAGSGDGVVQLLDLTVAPPHGRQGYGRRLMQAVYDQVAAYHRARRIKPRRLWIAVDQKAHINGRAFLTGQGFHHTATITELLKDQDALVYTRSFD